MASEKTPVVWDDDAKKHRPLGSGEKMGGLSASSMISSDSGNLLQQGSDGLMLVTGGSIADPRADNLLEESANGKLQVTSDRVVEWLESHPQAAAAIAEAVKVVSGDSGNVIVAGTDKGAFMSKTTLASAVSTMSASQLTTLANALRKQGGGLSVGSDGKLSVDFGSMDPAIMRNVVLSMVQQGGGIAVDSSGKLYVDFDSMPTDKFEALLKSLKMQVPLDSNLHQYVATNDPNAGDTDVDGRGTEAKPWKTIQACVTHVTTTYSLNTHNVYIHVKSGTYVESVTLPRFDATTGYIAISAHSGSRDVVIQSPITAAGIPVGCISASGGGSWRLENLHLSLTVSPVAITSYTARGLLSVGNNSVVSLYGIHFDQKAVAGAITGASMDIRVCDADNSGSIRFRHGSNPHTFSLSNSGTSGLGVYAIRSARGSEVVFYRSESDSASHAVECSGSCTTFAMLSDNSNFHSISTGSRFSFTGTVTGKRYSVTGGSYVNLGVDADYFPGDAAGTVDNGEDGRPQTYCWYN